MQHLETKLELAEIHGLTTGLSRIKPDMLHNQVPGPLGQD